MRGADIYSDYYLVRTRTRQLARNEEEKKGRERFDVRMLRSKDIKKRYNIEAKNKFQAQVRYRRPRGRTR